jgi:putative oxidoreductase
LKARRKDGRQRPSAIFLAIEMERSMKATLDQVLGSLADPFLFLARLLLAWLFVHEGFFLATHLDGALAAVAKLGVPAPAVIAILILQLAAGAAIVTGWQARLAAFALALFCIATATLFHTSFGNRDELLHFDKDLAIAGGMFLLAVHGAGTWSLDHLLGSRGIPRQLQRPQRQVAGDSQFSRNL